MTLLASEFLVDTDVVSYIAWKRPEARDFMPLVEGKMLAISFVTVGEMYFGAAHRGWGEKRISQMEEILRRYSTIPGTDDVAHRYGEVKKAFRSQVDENDMWIAATALAPDLPIITNNLKHFEPMGKRLGFGLVHPDR